MAQRTIRLRYAGACASCGSALPAKTTALWDSETKTATCTTCDPEPAADQDGDTPLVVEVDEPAAATGPTTAPSAELKIIRLRFAGTCSSCSSPLAAKTNAWWDSDSKQAICLTCRPDARTEAVGPPEKVVPEPDTAPVPATHSIAFGAIGDAGGSALAKYEKLHDQREKRIDARFGRLARVVKFLTDEPQSTVAWAQGAVGEQRLAQHLLTAIGHRAVLIHDRAVPRTRGNIDHLVIAATGVWVVDAKNYTGLVEHRNVGGWFSPDYRLYVRGRDRTKLADGLGWQVDAVRHALGEDVPIHAAVCFTDAEWRLFAKPFQHNGVWVTWARKLVDLIAAPGELTEDDVLELGERVIAAFPAKSTKP